MNPYQLPDDRYDYVNDLKCPVCLEVLACPVVHSCGHALCAACHFDCAARTSKRCPVCRDGEGAAPLPNKLADAAIWALVEKGANLEAQTHKGFTALMLACKNGHSEVRACVSCHILRPIHMACTSFIFEHVCHACLISSRPLAS